MNINFNHVDNVYIGSNKIDKMFLGNSLVYEFKPKPTNLALNQYPFGQYLGLGQSAQYYADGLIDTGASQGRQAYTHRAGVKFADDSGNSTIVQYNTVKLYTITYLSNTTLKSIKLWDRNQPFSNTDLNRSTYSTSTSFSSNWVYVSDSPQYGEEYIGNKKYNVITFKLAAPRYTYSVMFEMSKDGYNNLLHINEIGVYNE